MEMTQISIDLDVYKEIQQRLESFTDTPNQVLRRVFSLETAIEEPSQPLKGDLHIKGVVLKEGLKLSKAFKGQMFEAVVRDGRIDFKGKLYPTPSGAAVAAVGYNVNGWRFWDYFHDASGTWKPLNSLRR